MRSRDALTLLLLASAIAAQGPATHPGFVAMPNPPSLPAILQDVLPGEGWVPGLYNLREPAAIFDTWKPLRHRIALLEPQAQLTILAGLSEVDQPDLITVTSQISELQLKPGDSLLRYTFRGEGYADFWTNGRWYSDLDGTFITEADGTGCQRDCKARVLESGRKTWWFRVRLADDRLGWTDAIHSLNRNP